MPQAHSSKFSPSQSKQLIDLYDQGLYLQAYELSKSAGPLKTWTAREDRVFGARLANQLGSARLSRVLLRLAQRDAPRDPKVLYFYTYNMLYRWGTYKTFQFMKQVGDFDEAPSELQSDWFALRALLLSSFRDFERSEQWFNRAVELAPERAWLYVQRSALLEQQDRPAEAIEVAEHALQLRPWYRPSVANLASRYVQGGYDEKAIELLQQAIPRTESGELRMQLGALFLELERFEEAKALMLGIEEYFPLLKMEPKTIQGLASMSAEMHYYRGDFEQTIKDCKKADDPFYTEMAQRLADKGFEGKRVKLPVEFVRQDHDTCAPATLTSIANYWKMPAEHLDIVEKICYDGTPAHSERRWANENGFVTRDFRVTWEVAVALLDQGIPFTLTTTGSGNAHLQAVMGYDTYRKSLLIRDPGDRHSREFQTDKMLESYASSGPRGMALVPEAQAHLFESIVFPDCELYDLYFEMQLSLESHQRAEAEQTLKKMFKVDRKHRLSINAYGALARYDSDITKTEAALAKLSKMYPKDVNFKLMRLACLAELGKAEDRVRTLREINAEPDCDPLFWTQLAAELSGDARQHDTVKYLLHRAIKYRGDSGAAYGLLGSLYFEEQNQDLGVETLRLAACVDEKNEGSAKQYFYAARVTNDTSTAMRFLTDRVGRFGKKSSMPVRTLSWAYSQLDKSDEALSVLKTAYKTHSKDGDFLLYVAERFAAWGKFKKSEEIVEKAKTLARSADWTRIAAAVASYQGKSEVALKHWQAALKQDPLDSFAHQMVAQLLADTGGVEAAVAHLRKYVKRFPNSYTLRSMLVEALKDGSPAVLEKDLRLFMKAHPDDPWGLRELAILNMRVQKFDNAAEYVDRAMAVDPNAPANHMLKSRIHSDRNDNAAAIEEYRKALKLSIDAEYAISGLIGLCNAKTDREVQLQFVLEQLQKQVGFGDGLLTYHALAQSCLESKALLKILKKNLLDGDERWQARVVVIRQLSDMQRHEDAIKLAKQTASKFSLLPNVWLELASAYSACGKIDEEIQAIKKAQRINPTAGDTVRRLAEALEKKNDVAGARQEIEVMMRLNPRDVLNMSYLAGMMWDQDEKEEALQLIAKAVRLEPGFEQGWSALRAWCEMLGKPDFDVEVANELTAARPNEVRSWRMLAFSLDQPHQTHEALAALDHGLTLNPLSLDCHGDKVVLLARMGEYDEAIRAARPAVFEDNIPLELLARAAWVEAERGNFKKAVAGMEDVTRVDPDYFWAWQELATWYRYLEMKADFQTASSEMVRIQPQNPISWGYLGESAIALDDLDGAKEHFKQAVHLAPTYRYASDRLLDLLVDGKQWDEANEILEFVTPHLSLEWVLSEQIRIAALSGEEETAFEKLGKVFEIESEDVTAVDAAVHAMYSAGWGGRTLEFISKHLKKPTATTGVAYVFAHMSTSLKKWKLCERTLYDLRDRPQLWDVAAMKFLEEAAASDELKNRKRVLEFIKNNEPLLRAKTLLWESTGGALLQAGYGDRACRFMSDWSEREDASSLGLLSLSAALWNEKKMPESYRVSEHAINLPMDSASGHHRLLAALFQLVSHNPEAALQLVRDVNPTELSRYYQVKYEYVIGVLESLGPDGSYANAQRRIKESYDSLGGGQTGVPHMVRTYRLVRSAAAKLHGKKVQAWYWKMQAG